MSEETHIPQAPQPSLATLIEALLFIAPTPVSHRQLSHALGVSQEEVREALAELEKGYRDRGIRLQKQRGRVQLVSAPEAAPWIEHFLGLEATSSLSRAALETLAIIAYQQPATRPQVDAIRGVNSDGVIRTLLAKGLIQEAGRAEGPGRPFLYETTADFLRYFGLTSLEELPPLNLEEAVVEETPPNGDTILKG